MAVVCVCLCAAAMHSVDVRSFSSDAHPRCRRWTDTCSQVSAQACRQQESIKIKLSMWGGLGIASTLNRLTKTKPSQSGSTQNTTKQPHLV